MKLAKNLAEKLNYMNIIPVIVKTKYNVIKVYRDYARYDASYSIGPFNIKLINKMLFSRLSPIGFYGIIKTFNMFTGLFDRTTVEDMAEDSRIDKIYMDTIQYALSTVPEEGIYEIKGKKFTTTYWTKKIIGADKANKEGFKGEGIRVAVIDTGVQLYHKQIGRRWNRIEFYSVMPLQRIDANGHGSWCVTCIGGEIEIDEYTSKLVKKKVLVEGIAPETNIIAIKSLGYVIGVGATSQIIKGLEIAVKRNSDIVSMSLGGPIQSDNPEDDPYYPVMEYLLDNNIIPVVAAGNEGPKEGTISTPGALPQVLTVGAWDPINGRLAEFSSRGPTPWGDIKPDVIAPGVNISSGLTGILDYAFDKVSNRFSPLSGTSMATPHVSGLVSLMREYHKKVLGKTLTVNEIKEMMSEYAKDKGIEKDNNVGWGLITWDIYKWWIETQY